MKIVLIILGAMQILNSILGQYFGDWVLLQVIIGIIIGTVLMFYGDL